MQIDLSQVLNRVQAKLAEAMTTIAILELQVEALTKEADSQKEDHPTYEQSNNNDYN